MKIATNNIGNYSIRNFNNQPAAQVKKTAKQPETTASISNKEKEFFQKMYPSQRDEIINYHFYSKSGEMSGVAVGKNIDRRM